jgi:molybdopterin converting factor subunit 1
MRVRVLFFASVRELSGCRESEWEVPEQTTVGDLRRELVARYPALAALQRVLAVAVNAEYAADSTVLQPGDEVAFIPPVSGGRDVQDHG